MSLGARATKGGAKGKDRHAQDKGKPDKPQPKEKTKPQATTEQLRMANMIDRKSTDDGADVRKMVQDLMEMTCRTEEEVCSALHDTDNDMLAACNLLLEAQHTVTGEWQTNEKKKKKPPQPTNNGDVEPPREARSRSGPRPPRRGSGERGEGGTRGRGGGRGGRGARGGGRGAGRGGRARRPHNHDWPHQQNTHADSNQMGDTFPTTEDWDNEEWSGSLSDTKVFTPSSSVQASLTDAETALQPPATEDWDASPAVASAAANSESQIPTYTYHNTAQHHPNIELGSSRESPAATEPQHPPEHFLHHAQPMGMSGSLSAAQSQYLSQLTQQSQRHENNVYGAGGYGVYGDMASQRKPQRARVPPPSKIPVSAVEMPGGEAMPGMFLDVQFGALDPDALQPPPEQPPQSGAVSAESQVTESVTEPPPPAAPAPAPAAAPAPAPATHQPYHNNNNMLNDSLSSETSSSQVAPAQEPVTSVANVSLEKQLADTMKQLGVTDAPQHHHRTKSGSGSGGAGAGAGAPPQNMYQHPAAAQHHPAAVYSANVYAPQVNSSTAGSLSASGAMPNPYPSSVTLTQYQPIINSYQTSTSAAAYNSSALYTAPYSYTHHHHHTKHHKDAQPQYESNSVSSSNSLASTSTTQTSTAKVATTTGHTSSTANATSAVTAGVAAAGAGAGAGGGVAAGAGAAGYAGALYGSQGYYDDQIMRSTMPHHAMGGYYEVGYGARDGTFGLNTGERFGRTDAASPQQVPQPTLPPGYAYFTYPPPTTYQYGVYPYGGASSVGGVGGVGAGKVGTYAQQQPPYDAQDTYKQGNVYSGSGSKASGAASELTSAMYAKTHVTLNKVNSYEKATFHSGTPPPFGAASHLYIPAPPHHHHHAPQHQMDVRMNSSQNRRESGSAGGRAGSNKPAHNKATYAHSYWPPN